MTATVAPAVAAASPLAGFGEFAAGTVAKYRIPAVAVAAAHAGQTLFEGGFGHRDAARTLPVTPDTIFGIGSVSKIFTAIAVLQLQEAGRLAVTDPVTRWLPAFRLPRGGGASAVDHTPAVTLHHLLTHTSGLPPEYAMRSARLGSMRTDPDLPWMTVPPRLRRAVAEDTPISTYAALIDLVGGLGATPLAPPGQLFSYSNEGYALLAAIVERAADLSFAEYLAQGVTTPLGLTHTACLTPDYAPASDVALVYSRGTRAGQPGIYPSPHWWTCGRIFGHGSMVSTARDLLRLLNLLLGGGELDGARLLCPDSVPAMAARHAAIPTGGFYGYALMVQPDYAGLPGVDVIGHGGGSKGVSAYTAFEPRSGAAAVGLASLASAPTQLVAGGALSALLGLPFTARPRAFPALDVPPTVLAEYAGAYRSEDGATITIGVEGAALTALTEDLPLVKARPYAPDSFVVPGADLTARFLRDDHGAIWAIHTGLRAYRRTGGSESE
ncbi:MAG TPA: serine hydrolase domain-containing protein [Chloroflexota bacterium]|nr:serine hydrolase domain-containing protein [Chloroflexota bacterium]